MIAMKELGLDLDTIDMWSVVNTDIRLQLICFVRDDNDFRNSVVATLRDALE